MTWSRDGDGYINYTAYDPVTGAAVKQIADVNTADTSDFSGLPAGWATPAGGGLELVTALAVDPLGRDTKITSPSGNLTYVVFNDPAHERRTYPGWNPTTGTTTGPIQVSRLYYPAASSGGSVYSETLASSAAPAVSGSPGSYVPTGGEAFTSADIQGLSRDITNGAGQVVETDAYASLSGVTYSQGTLRLGSAGANYEPTTTGYGGQGNAEATTTPNGTITFTVTDGQGRSVGTWVGTDDAGATPADPTGGGASGNNMTRVTADLYDQWPSALPAPAAPALSLVASGGSQPDTTYYVKVTYVDARGESLASAEASLLVPSGDLLAVASPAAAGDATGYNVYVGSSAGDDALQTTTPVPLGTDFTLPDGSLASGPGVPLGGIGDGNLTQETDYPGGGAAPRVTRTAFDWRDRPVASKSGVLLNADGTEDTAAESDGTHRPLAFVTYDNLGEVTESRTYDGDGVALTSTAGAPDAPDASLLRSNTVNAYDEQGRVYQSTVYPVDPATGAVGAAGLAANTYYDHRGDVIETAAPGGAVTKSAIDGAGRTTATYTTDGASGPGWANASTVSGDHVLEQVASAYDADGDVTQTTDARRDHDYAGAGALPSVTTDHAARVSYAGAWYDAAGRPTAAEDVGTNGGAAWSRPASPDARDDTHLVTSTTYGAMGLADAVTDPRGIVGKTFYDLLGRPTKTIAAYTGGTPTSSTDQTTTYTYDGDDNLTSQTAVMPSGTPGQTTAYVYGVTTASGSAISSNDLLAKVEYPDKATGNASTAASDDVSGTYDALGEPLTTTDQNGTTHAFGYDLLGRQTSDAVTALGSGVDGAVRLHATSYDTQGRVYQLTAYASPTGGAVLNQVRDVYNGLGQMTGQYQSHGGAVTASTPEVRYAYAGPSSTQNYSRVSAVTYPNGRVLHYGYAGGIDDAVSRVSFLADDDGGGGVGSHLADYAYLGPSTVVKQAGGNGASLTYVGTATGDGGDQYAGLDRFGRVIDQDYVNTATGTSTDRFQYGYDRDSNVLYKNNLVNSGFSELYHANSTATGDNNTGYDPLSRLTTFSRGALSASGHNGSSGPGSLDAIASAGQSASWSLDALGNWSSSTSGSTTTSRTHNSRNEATGVGSNTLAFDNNGDTTTDEQGRHLAYDAWGQLVSVKDGSGNTIAAYTTDAAGRRITQAGGSGPATDLYYSGQNVVEERQGSTVTAQNVWGITYANDPLLRDDNSTPGSLGVAASGLGRRLYAQHDANYDVTALTDASGNVVERFAYDPYGSVTVLSPLWTPTAGDATGWEYLFQDMRLDPATSLYHTPNREYSTTLARWFQADPAGYLDGDSLYQYVGGSPANGVDPTGLSHIDQLSEYLFPEFSTPASSPIVHPNALASTATNHLYGINDTFHPHGTYENTWKYGISGQELYKNGTSPRANGQVAALNKEAGCERYKATILDKQLPGREVADAAEKAKTQEFVDEFGRMPRGMDKPKVFPRPGTPGYALQNSAPQSITSGAPQPQLGTAEPSLFDNSLLASPNPTLSGGSSALSGATEITDVAGSTNGVIGLVAPEAAAGEETIGTLGARGGLVGAAGEAIGWLMIVERYTVHTAANESVWNDTHPKSNQRTWCHQLQEDIKDDLERVNFLIDSLFFNRNRPYQEYNGA